MSAGSTIRLDIIRNILSDMPRQRFQDPKIQQSKNGCWFIRPWVDLVTPQGVERRKKTIVLGPSDIGKRAAIAAKNEVMRSINRADYVIRSQVRFGEMLDRWLSVHVAELGYGTRLKYESHVRNHIRPAFGDLTMLELGSERIQKWLQEKAKTGVCWSTRADLRNILSGIFARAKEWGLYNEENPLANVKLGRKKLLREKRKLSENQTRYFLAALPYELRVMCCVSLFCTLRVSEALGLQEKHLDFENRLMRIEQRFYRGDLDDPKNDKSRRLVSMGHLEHDLKQLCLGDPERYVFQIKTRPKWGTKSSGRLQPKSVSRDDRDLNQHFLRPIAKELGFYWKGFGFHSLRREAITVIGSVAGLGQAMNAAGHTHADMSLLYTLQDRTEQERAIKAHHERILGKPEGSVQ